MPAAANLLGLALALALPGVCARGEPGDCDGPTTPIGSVQGAGDASPREGERVTVAGIVTASFQEPDALRGYFLQEPVGDGDPATSDGIFVFEEAPAFRPGERLRVRGRVTEFFGLTELTEIEAVTRCGRGRVAATPLAPPFSPEALERRESMLVRVVGPLAVSDTARLHRFGEVGLAVGAPLESPTNRAEGRADPEAAARANAARSLLLDDGSTRLLPEPVPYLREETLRRGDTLPELVGVLAYGFDAWRVQPAAPLRFAATHPRPPPPRTGGNVRVASFNLENYWTTIDDGENRARGPDSAAERERQRRKIAAAVEALDPDVLAVQELENDGPRTVDALARTLDAAAGAAVWRAVTGPEAPGPRDAIRVGLLYRADRLVAVGAAQTSADPAFAPGRPPLAQTFRADGERVSVVVAHLKSKGCSGARGPDADAGDGQGCWNDRRTRQARALLDFVRQVAAAAGDPDVLLVGDLNAYAAEDPIRVLAAELAPLLGPGAWSYVFRGRQGLLDHAFATPSLASRVTGAAVWHANADEPEVLGYDDAVVDPGERPDEARPDLFRPDPFRSSDHDPVVVGLALGGAGAADPTVGGAGAAYSR